MNFSHTTYKPLEPGQNVSTSGEILAYAATTHPGKPGLISNGASWTFKQLDGLANQFANALVERFHGRDGTVGIISNNNAEYVIAHFGTARTGRYFANFTARSTPEDLAYTVNLTRPIVLIVDPDCRDIVEEARSHFRSEPELLLLGKDRDRLQAPFWKFLEGQADTLPDIDIDPDTTGSIIFTGGTTGKPKAVISSQRARAISAMAGVEDFRIGSDLIAGFTVPFSHTAGLFSWFQPAVLAGCTGVAIPRWDPELFMQMAEQYAINVIFAVPAQLATLLEHPAFDATRLRSLELIVFGGAALSQGLIERAEKAMPWMSCARAYGSTETGHLAAQIKSDRAVVYDGYNQPGGRLEIEIFKQPGVPVAQGEVGEVATRGPHLMTGYLENDAAATAFFKSETTAGDWGWMGDLAIKHDGFFTLVGRSKHMILSGGFNIYPAELETILSQHPDVLDCVVFGIEDETWGELPAAAIVARSTDPDTSAIINFVAQKVARYKRVRQIFVVDQIPRTAAGKAQIHLISEQCRKMADNNKHK